MLILPFKGSFTVTQKFNDSRYRSSYTKFGLLGHNGIDYGTPVGVELIAPISGVVKETDVWDPYGYGWYIKIQNEKEGTVIGHMREQSKLKPGTVVKQGDKIGFSGNTGNSTGPHLHWGFWREVRDRDNGFNGFMDQTYWMKIDDELEAKFHDLTDSFNKLNIKHKETISSLETIRSIASDAINRG